MIINLKTSQVLNREIMSKSVDSVSVCAFNPKNVIYNLLREIYYAL